MDRLHEMRDRAALEEKAAIALQIAHAAGDAEATAKYRALNDPRKFWAYVAAERPVYAYKTCVEFERRACQERDQWLLFARNKSA